MSRAVDDPHPPPLPDGSDHVPAAAERTAQDGGGAFWRDAAGVWRYRFDDEVVPGAADLTLGELFDPPWAERDGEAVRVVPRAWASRHPDHPLAWVFEHATLGGREPIAVPAAAWAARADEVVAMAAPDLHLHNLIGIDGVAAVAAVSEGTVRAYVARGQMPPPIARFGGSPVWSRPLVERWLRERPRRAGSPSGTSNTSATSPAGPSAPERPTDEPDAQP